MESQPQNPELGNNPKKFYQRLKDKHFPTSYQDCGNLWCVI